jgi:S1-C subfamily serine protease
MLPKWREKYSTNIVGVHIGLKHKKNLKTKNYAIIFHVQQKLGIPISKIPSKISIPVEKQRIYLPTDIIETGITKLRNVMMGDKAQSLSNPDEFGSAGLFLTINGDLYVCSNMHVLGPQHIADRSYSCPPAQQFRTDVICSNDSDEVKAFLEKAVFDETDLAVARFQFPNKVTNRIRKLGQPAGFLEDDKISEGMNIQMSGARSGRVVFGKVEAIGVSRIVRYDNIRVTISDLIATSLSVLSGDSGSVVVNEFLEVVGILVSSDEQFAYVIPWSSIKKFISNL